MSGEGWLLAWNEAVPAGIAVCGGKGWNLARLERYGFPVPAGGVLSARAYHALLADCLASGEAAQLQALRAESVLEAAVVTQLQRLRERILATPLPAGVETSLMAFLDRQGLLDTLLAVRSSAVAEDGEHHSFAGIHQSVLNVPGRLTELGEAVRRCYASLWTPQAVAYRRHAAIRDDACGCAVVLCQMVATPGAMQPQAAGVLFTCDPLTGRRDQAVINSVPGLAERLVAGAELPEQCRVTTHLLHYQVIAREQPAGMAAVLDDEVLVALARWGVRAQWALGAGDLPQDMEWAYDGRQLWFLQARPVTRLPHRSFAPLAKLPVIWSNANLKEVVGGLPSTFAWSVIQDAVRDLLFTPLQAVGYSIPEGMALLRRFRGRSYFDLSALQWAYYDCFGYHPEQLNRELGGNQPTIPVPPGDPLKGSNGKLRQRRQLRALLALRGIGRRLARAHDEALARVVAFRHTPLDRLDDGQLRLLLQEWHAYGIPHTHLFQFANSDAGIWLKFSRDLLTRLDPAGGEALLGRLLAAGGQMPSAEALHQLHALAVVAAADPVAGPWLRAHHPADPAGADGWEALPAKSPFRTAFAAYLQSYGHRALDETELAQPRWHEAPQPLLQEIARLLETPQADSMRKGRERRSEAEGELRRLPWWARPLVRWLAARARRGMAHRELGKSLAVAVLEPLRQLALEVGRRLAARGLLRQHDQVFQLALADLEALLAGNWDGRGAEQLATDREQQRQAWREETAADVIIEGDAAALRESPAGEAHAGEEAFGWRGIGVSP
ncbi:MAG TPA: PEP/pyruvate-binding domain-containing protein, partial [Gammaproteobacteria bacterium]